MDSPDNKKLSEIVDRVRSWIPRRSEPSNMSRDFWMPDQSCRVCYECDSQFTIFNRRHHCRICGRVFCAKCTPNFVPAPLDELKTSREDWERIRVCNYCFKQWEQGKATVDNGITASSPGLSPSPSAASLVSTQSSGTCNSGSSVGATPYSTGPYHHVPYSSAESPLQSNHMDEVRVQQDQTIYAGKSESIDARDPFSDKFGSYSRCTQKIVICFNMVSFDINMKWMLISMIQIKSHVMVHNFPFVILLCLLYHCYIPPHYVLPLKTIKGNWSKIPLKKCPTCLSATKLQFSLFVPLNNRRTSLCHYTTSHGRIWSNLAHTVHMRYLSDEK